MKKRMYIDKRGWKYRVMPGLGNDTFKARYQKPDKHGFDGWKGVASLPWRDSWQAAQMDLDRKAASSSWKDWNGGET